MHEQEKQVQGMLSALPWSWDQIDARPIPTWFTEAGLGIFIHWGLYSVPAWAPRRKEVSQLGHAYAEWYGYFYKREGSPFEAFHRRVYGDAPYASFADQWKAELFDPDAWAECFQQAGAKYVVITAKHHDGFCLYPSALAQGWNSVDRGPRRDLVGELAKAVRRRGMIFGIYYSLLEWDHEVYHADVRRYSQEHMKPQIVELVERYRPDIFWTDGEWEHTSESFQSRDILTWFYTASPVADRIVVNDRWGSETRSTHGGIYTTEYGEVDPSGRRLTATVPRPWEECRSLGFSFGHNRNERLEDYLSDKQVIHLADDVAARGGNLLLNVGPTHDGRITLIAQQRLDTLGRYLLQSGRRRVLG